MRSEWEELRREAHLLESSLEEKLQALASINQKLGSEEESKNDEENEGLISSEEKENQLFLEIEKLLAKLSSAHDRMNAVLGDGSNRGRVAYVQRCREVLFEFRQQFRKTQASISHKREKSRLFGGRRDHAINMGDEGVDQLLRERNAISGSQRMAADIIGQAMASKSSLESQRSTLGHTSSRLQQLSLSQLPGVNSLIGLVQRKTRRDNAIVALTIGGCISLTLWYILAGW